MSVYLSILETYDTTSYFDHVAPTSWLGNVKSTLKRLCLCIEDIDDLLMDDIEEIRKLHNASHKRERILKCIAAQARDPRMTSSGLRMLREMHREYLTTPLSYNDEGMFMLLLSLHEAEQRIADASFYVRA